MDKNTNISEIFNIFIESSGNLGQSLGVSKVVTQIYALLYLSDKPLSLDDIVEQLKISKGNVCVNIKYLEQWQAVKKIWTKGSRKDYYQANLDVEKIILNRLKEGLDRRFSEFLKNVEKVEKILQTTDGLPEDNELLQSYKKKIQKIRDLSALMEKALKIGRTFIN
ncbi:MAG: hypothetical protein A2252_03230 [Elusimicrobia bacterium RIFOXYA2_FULL_39_19]|nr:MAG: hypothetical protein A2252_03230 [Elusimicrobia bacterium RIFOXYA2_FULL_39_19]